MSINKSKILKISEKISTTAFKSCKIKSKTNHEYALMRDMVLSSFLFDFGHEAGINVKAGMEEEAILGAMKIFEAVFRKAFSEGRKQQDTKGDKYVH